MGGPGTGLRLHLFINYISFIIQEGEGMARTGAHTEIPINLAKKASMLYLIRINIKLFKDLVF